MPLGTLDSSSRSTVHPDPYHSPAQPPPSCWGKGRGAGNSRVTSRDAAGLLAGRVRRPRAFLREALAVPAVGSAAWRGKDTEGSSERRGLPGPEDICSLPWALQGGSEAQSEHNFTPV